MLIEHLAEHPMRLARGSYRPDLGRGCAMNVLSFINGDAKITDFPSCSAPPLARIVQVVNDYSSGQDGYLSPEAGLSALDLAWKTNGTGDVLEAAQLRWLAELLDQPWALAGVRVAAQDQMPTVRRAADTLRRQASGEAVHAEQQALHDALKDAAQQDRDVPVLRYWILDGAAQALRGDAVTAAGRITSVVIIGGDGDGSEFADIAISRWKCLHSAAATPPAVAVAAEHGLA